VSNRLFAYDYANDRNIPKHDMPNYTSDGVTGVINGKLYVLPGVCGGDHWPDPGYCDTGAFRNLFRYDPATDAWTKMGRPQDRAFGPGPGQPQREELSARRGWRLRGPQRAVRAMKR
jgi:hypothetical protein